ncbi:MAG: undecaprenyl/decaprenyl-phosphate alpha-N-acetylglucosaminyl 1-phosphate transferase [Gemmatimonadota bacterium]|nr:undecaprenyl/decaprenyl-phosphate alpha-N-acetylglucosaminyl 1-phosphate transferase [Gemmatimonadota bacterium]
MLVAVGIAAVTGDAGVDMVLQQPELYGGIFGGATLLLAIGLADDFLDLSPAVKLIAQGMAAMFAVSGGLSLQLVQFGPHTTVSLGWVGIPLTMFWIIAVTNAFNFIDGLDGLASSIGIVGFGATLVSAALLGRSDVMMLSLVLIGALLGFLRYNLAPARIYLGDCGSLLIGYLLATLSLVGATSATSAALVYVPVFALALPLLDGTIAIVRRWLRRMPVWKGDHRHIHHRVLALGLSKPQSVGVLVVVAAAFAAAGVATSFATPVVFVGMVALCVTVTVAAAVLGLRLLDYYEFAAARSAVRRPPSSWRQFIREEIRLRDAERELATARDLNDLRTGLDRCALAFGLDRVEISRQRPRLRRAWRGEHLDVPVGSTEVGAGDPWMLRVWHGEYDSPSPELVQRAARVLGSACGQWLRTHGLLDATPWTVAAAGRAYGRHEGPTLPRGQRHLAKA